MTVMRKILLMAFISYAAVLVQQSVLPAFFDIRIPVGIVLVLFAAMTFSRGSGLMWLCWVIFWSELLPHSVSGGEAVALCTAWLMAIVLFEVMFTDLSIYSVVVTGVASLSSYALISLAAAYAAYILDARALLPAVDARFWAEQAMMIVAGSALLVIMLMFGRLISRRLNLAFLRD